MAIAQTGWTQIKGCKSLRSGKFKLVDEYAGTTIITRTETIQREENDQYGTITEDKIKWINNCTYRLTPYKVVRNESNLDLSMDFKMEIEIVEIKENSYTRIATARRTKQTIKSEVEILE